jgi:hypothetical protein
MADAAMEIEQGLDELIDMVDDGFEDITGDDPVEEEPQDESESESAQPVEDSESSVEVEEAVEEAPEVEYVEESVDEQPDVDDRDSADAVDDEPVDDGMAALRTQNEALLERIEALSGQVIGGVMQPQTQAAPQAQQAPAQQQVVNVPTTPAAMQNFLENTSIDDLLENPEKFNAVLNQVSQQSQQAATQGAVQQVLRSVPELVMGYITRHSAMNRMVDDFYLENADLANVKQTVAAVANDVHSKNPELGVEEVFKQSAEATRKLLGLQKQAKTVAKRKPLKPAFAKAGGARKVAPQINGIQREINDLLSGDF